MGNDYREQEKVICLHTLPTPILLSCCVIAQTYPVTGKRISNLPVQEIIVLISTVSFIFPMTQQVRNDSVPIAFYHSATVHRIKMSHEVTGGEEMHFSTKESALLQSNGFRPSNLRIIHEAAKTFRNVV